MPEGVEVKLSADLIKPLIVDQIIIETEFTSNSRYATSLPDNYHEFTKNLQEPCKVTDIKTKGKFMYWTFNNGWYMLCTFGMTGQWSPKRGKHPCLVIKHAPSLQDNVQEMVFNDPRHFGTIKFTNDRQEVLQKLNDELGWDPLGNYSDDESIKWMNWIYNKTSKSSKPIGQVLMDQAIFAGVGNYIRAEALYVAKISPWRLCKSLSKNETTFLCQAIIKVMQDSYQHQGATIQTYRTAYGEEGRYSSCFKVYGQDADPQGNKIKKESTPDGRTIHWCPAVQV
jgi:formamidopyrimidine-DNA glycosylase